MGRLTLLRLSYVFMAVLKIFTKVEPVMEGGLGLVDEGEMGTDKGSGE
jgi:hypothetical protein